MAELLLTEADRLDRRLVVGLTGPPGAGKSTLAKALARALGGRGGVVPMDGFHFADVELDRQGLRNRKGAPETFDAWGYAALLRRLHEQTEDPVYAPGFDRSSEQPIAGSIAVPTQWAVVLTEGNYLLLDRAPWRAVRTQLDQVWHVCTDERRRLERLEARHVHSGKTAAAAREWVTRVDQPNAGLVERTRGQADRRVDLSDWVARC